MFRKMDSSSSSPSSPTRLVLVCGDAIGLIINDHFMYFTSAHYGREIATFTIHRDESCPRRYCGPQSPYGMRIHLLTTAFGTTRLFHETQELASVVYADKTKTFIATFDLYSKNDDNGKHSQYITLRDVKIPASSIVNGYEI